MGETVIDLSRADIARSVRHRSHAHLARTTLPSVRKRRPALLAQATNRSDMRASRSVRKRSPVRLVQATLVSIRAPTLRYNGAGNGIRTRDPQLGRLALYR